MTPACSQPVIDLAAYRKNEGNQCTEYELTTDSRGVSPSPMSRAESQPGETAPPQTPLARLALFQFQRKARRPALKNSPRLRALNAERGEPRGLDTLLEDALSLAGVLLLGSSVCALLLYLAALTVQP